MSIRSSVLIVVLAGISIASGSGQVPKVPKNLIGNGDFAAGTVNWVGDGKVSVYKADPGPPAKSGSALDALKPAPPADPATPAAPGKANADVDRAYCVTLGNRVQSFSQKISVPRNATALKISFRARTSNGFLSSRSDVGAFQLKLMRPAGGSTFNDKKLDKGMEWQSFEWNHGLTDASRSLQFVIEVYPGVGQLYFDDFFIVSPGN